MIDVPPLIVTAATSLVSAPNAISGDGNLILASVQEIPEKLADLLRQIQLNGPVINLQADGTFIVRTGLGDIKLLIAQLVGNLQSQLGQQLSGLSQTQKPLTIMVQPGNPPTQAYVAIPSAPAASSSQPTPVTAPITGRRGDIQIVPGTTVSAVILPNKVGENFMALSERTYAPPPVPTTNKDVLPFTIPAKDAAQPAPIQTQLKPETNAPLETAKQPTVNLPTASDRVIATLSRQGTEVSLRIEIVIRPNTSNPQTILPPQIADNQIVATVIGNGPNGQLLINAGENTLFVRQGSNVPVGTQLLLTLLPPKADEVAIIPQHKKDELVTLQQIMQALVKIDPQAAQNVMKYNLPQPNQMLPGTLLFMLSALSQGDFKDWLGKSTLEKLSKTDSLGLLEKLAGELAQNSGVARDTTVGEWKSLAVPFYDSEQYQLLRFYVRNDKQQGQQKEQSGNRPTSPQTRFLIEISLSRLGAMQVDGLAQTKKLDLVMRSERPLPPTLPNELRSLYITTLEAIDFTGSIRFQTGRQNWIHMHQDNPIKGVVM